MPEARALGSWRPWSSQRALPPACIRRPYVAPATLTFNAIDDSYCDSDGPVDYDIGAGVVYRRPPRPTSMPPDGIPMLG